MICKKCGSKLNRNNKCPKCGYDNNYHMEKLPAYLEKINTFIAEGIYEDDENSTSDMQDELSQDEGGRLQNAQVSGQPQKVQNVQVANSSQTVAQNAQTARPSQTAVQNAQAARPSQTAAQNPQIARYSQTQQHTQPSGHPQKSMPLKLWIIFGIAGVLCICGVIVIFLLAGGNHNKDVSIVFESQETVTASSEFEETKDMMKQTETETGVESETESESESETETEFRYKTPETKSSEAQNRNVTSGKSEIENDRNLNSQSSEGSEIIPKTESESIAESDIDNADTSMYFRSNNGASSYTPERGRYR